MKKFTAIKKNSAFFPFFLLLLLIAVGLLIRLKPILTGIFPFSFDMARDMVWVRDIVVLRKPTLIGPWGSLAGIFFGPAWYYLLAVPFAISNGHPAGSVTLCLFFNLLTALVAFFIGKEVKNSILGIIFAFLLVFSPTMVNLSSFAFHANLLPFTSLLIFYSLYKLSFLETKGQQALFISLAAFATALNFHFEPATAIFSTLTVVLFLLFLIFRRKISLRPKNLMVVFLSFLIPFIPQIIFEFRHNFLQTRALIAYFLGENQSLEGKLPFLNRLEDRIIKFDLFYKEALPFKNVIFQLAFIILILFVFFNLSKKDEKTKKAIVVSAFSIFIPLFGFIFLFPPELKLWYLYCLPALFSLIIGLVIGQLFSLSRFFKFFSLIFLFSYPLSLNFSDRLNFSSQGVSGLGNFNEEVKVTDYILNDANKNPFKVYTFTPPVYDYQYQYLFWWRGREQKFWPEEYSYLPGKKDYVPNKDKYNEIQKTVQAEKPATLIYLIIEDKKGRGFEGWYDYFSQYSILTEKKFSSGLIVEKRQNTLSSDTIKK